MIEYKDIYDYLDQVARCDQIPTLAGWVHWRKYATVTRSGSIWQIDPSDIAVEVTVTVPGGVGLNVTSIQAGGVVKTVPQYVENTYYADDVWAVFPAPHIVGGISVLPPTSTRPLLGMATWIVNLEDTPLAAGWGAKAYLHDPIIHSNGEWVTFDRTAVKVKMMSRNATDSDAIAVCDRAWNSTKTGVPLQTAILEAAAFNGVQLSAVPKGLPVPSVTGAGGGNASSTMSGGTYTMTTPAGSGTYTWAGKQVTAGFPAIPTDDDIVDDGPSTVSHKGPNRKQVILRLEEEMRDKLAALAKADGRSVNHFVSEMIRRELEERTGPHAAWKDDQFIVSWKLHPEEDTEQKQNQIKRGIVDLISAYGGKGVWIRNRFLPGPAIHPPAPGATWSGGGPFAPAPTGTFWMQLHDGPFGSMGYDHIIGVERIECVSGGPASQGGVTLTPVTGWNAFPYTTTVTHWTLWSDAKNGSFLFGDKFTSPSNIVMGQNFVVVDINVSLNNLAP